MTSRKAIRWHLISGTQPSKNLAYAIGITLSISLMVLLSLMTL